MMDPEETLALARKYAREGQYETAGEYYEMLDRWVSRGGFRPGEWNDLPTLPDDIKLTPTEELFMETLAARTRLGHELWTFSSHPSIRKAADRLETMLLVETMHGVTEKTFRANLTRLGKVYACDDPNYVPPIQGGPK